uniref:HDC02593 n=1 Tax=Drosophila melanogaster TaxID=7227 RepID=Q6IHG9_DROME|nr:TPA_inf: HDC02593 [Drosophila melanogaster]
MYMKEWKEANQIIDFDAYSGQPQNSNKIQASRQAAVDDNDDDDDVGDDREEDQQIAKSPPSHTKHNTSGRANIFQPFGQENIATVHSLVIINSTIAVWFA